MANNKPILIAEPPPESTAGPPITTTSRSLSLRTNLSSGSQSELQTNSTRTTFPIEILEKTPSRNTAPSRSFSEKLGSARELNDADARLVHISNPNRPNTAPTSSAFVDNSISTTKYSILSFIPKNLFEQFHRVAYVYFLVLAIINFIPQLVVFSPTASVLPLVFVLAVTAVKDAYEDWRRHRSDRHENNRKTLVLSTEDGEFKKKCWKDVLVGEIIKVSANETIPCDMVLLSTSDPTGVAYVQTINLDGESNLKTRYAKQETVNLSVYDVNGVIRCEKPNKNIYAFQGNIEIDGDVGRRISLGASNIVLRGCEIKNTKHIVGVAVYTGEETKVMMNSSGAPWKRSRLESNMNREVIFLAVLLAVLCCIVTILAGIWLRRHEDELDDMPFYRRKEYYDNADDYKYYGIAGEAVLSFLSSLIVFQVMVPIALYISMELVRVGQAYFMIQDKEMFDEVSGAMFQCRALNINEDLGQIKYVFSDKTGTLTENKMVFRCASIYGMEYNATDTSDGDHAETNSGSNSSSGSSLAVNGEILRPKVLVKTDPELLKVLRSEEGAENANKACDFFLALACCNTIVPIVDPSNPNAIDYQGESPDEQALVYAAAAYGFMLVERTSGHIIIDVLGHRQRYILYSYSLA